MTKKFYIDIPYEEKDEAKAFGAKWDIDEKKWYVKTSEQAEEITTYLNSFHWKRIRSKIYQIEKDITSIKNNIDNFLAIELILINRLDKVLKYNNFENTFYLFAKRLVSYEKLSNQINQETPFDIVINCLKEIDKEIGEPLSYKDIKVQENSYQLIELSGTLQCMYGTCEIETCYKKNKKGISAKLLANNFKRYIKSSDTE